MTWLYGWNRNLILAVLLLALGTFAYWLEFTHKPKKELQEEDKKRAFILNETPLKSVKIVSGSSTFAFICKETDVAKCSAERTASWELTEPRIEKADSGNVGNLLSALNSTKATEIIDLKDDAAPRRNQLLKEYGLDKETREKSGMRRAEVEFADGKKQLAYFGGTHPIGDSIFTITTVNSARGGVDDTRILLFPSTFKNHFDFPLTHWRNKRLFESPGASFPSIEYESKSTKFRGEKKQGAWILWVGTAEKPESVPGDTEVIDSLLSNATYLSAREFVADDKDSDEAKAELKNATQIVTLKLRRAKEDKTEPSNLTLEVWDKGGKPERILATVSNLKPLFELNSSAKAHLLKSIKELRMSKLIATTDRVMANKIVVMGAGVDGPGFTLTKNASHTWVTETPEYKDQQVDQTKVARFLDLLSAPRIQDFVKIANSGDVQSTEKDGWKIIVSTEDKPDGKKFSVWTNAGRWYARDQQSRRGEIFKLDDQLRSGLPTKKNSFFKEPPKPDASGTPGTVPQPPAHEGHSH